jgi:hypothetical protein
MPCLTQLGIVLTCHANRTLDGGTATAAALRRDLVEKRRRLTGGSSSA